MIITKKAIPRRTVLRGIGAAIALPFLDSMVPALTATSKTSAPLRFGTVYVPNGILMEQWTPSTTGGAFEFTPTLKALEAFRKHLLLVSGLHHRTAVSDLEVLGQHARPAAAFLTGIRPKRTTGTALQLGRSLDQILAQHVSQETRLGSLEIGLETTDTINGVGSCDPGFSCAYLNISWRNATTPMPMETNPRMVFERMFGDVASMDPATRRAQARTDRSILDAVREKVGGLRQELGGGDRNKLNEYLDAVRDAERRIQQAEQPTDRDLPVLDRPAGIPVTYDEHAKVMFDLQALAYQADVTRVVTFMIGREQSGLTYPHIGVADPHHPISHHAGNRDKMASLAKINSYHVSLFSNFLEKLRSTPDGDGSLLDHVMILYGSGISDGNKHAVDNLPLLLAGGACGHVTGGRHVRVPSDTPLTNLQLTILEAFGVSMDQFGDSTGTCNWFSDLA